jgi:hypothetical protein
MTNVQQTKPPVRMKPVLGLCALMLAIVGYVMLAIFVVDYVPGTQPWYLRVQRQKIDVAMGVVMFSSTVGIAAIFSKTEWNRVIGLNLNYFNVLTLAALLYMLSS